MKYYLTTPIYYVNAAPHIGHTYTTLAADTIKRFKTMQGFDPVVLTTGTDEHGQKVERSAKAAGKTPQKPSPTPWPPSSSKQWDSSGSSTTVSSAPPIPSIAKPCSGCSSAAWSNGYIYKGSYTGQYCVLRRTCM